MSLQLPGARRCRHDGIGENTISKAHKFLNETLEYAKERELIEENPLSRLKRADIPVEPQGTRGSLEAGETKRIIRLVADEMSSGYHVAVFLALGYELRRGECLGLTWENVNLSEDSPSIFIETQRTQYELAGTPKTKKSRRLIPIDESTREILSAWKKRQASHLEAAGAKQDGETCVCTSAGGKRSASINWNGGGINSASTMPFVQGKTNRRDQNGLTTMGERLFELR